MSSHLMETPLTTALKLVNHAIAQLKKDTAQAQAVDTLQQAASLLSKLDPYLDSVSSKGPPGLQPLLDETDRHDWKAAFESGQVGFLAHPGWSAGGYEGNFIATVARAINAKRVLEVGMFTGTTTLCVADALPEGGKLISLEQDAYFKKLATPFFEKAGVSSRIDVRVAPAQAALERMAKDKEQAFDLIFIDADKTGYLKYYETILDSGLLRRGGVLLVDNTLYKGLPFTPELHGLSQTLAQQLNLESANGLALAEFNKHVAADPRVVVSLLPIRDGVSWIMHAQDDGHVNPVRV